MTTRNPMLILACSVAAALTGAALPAAAQQVPAADTALTFNTIFNIGGIGDRDPNNFIGSVGCGSGTGGNLSSLMNRATGGDFIDKTVANVDRNDARDFWRFCDNMTTNNGGWSFINIANGLDGSVDEERLQNTALAPDELFAQIDQAASMTRAQLGNVGARIRGTRLAALGLDQGVRYAGANDSRLDVGADGSVSLTTGLNAGDELNAGPGLGFFVNGRFIDIEADGTGVETGSKTDGFGFTVGIDYPFSANFIGGIGIGYTELDSTFDSFGAGTVASTSTADSSVENLAFQVFFSYFPNESLYFDGIVGTSKLDFKFTKVVPAFDMGQANADPFAPLTSSPEGDTVFANFGVGYDVRKDGFTFTPTFRVEYLKTEIDGFTEQTTGSDNTLSLTIAGQENTSVTGNLGATIAWPRSISAGVIMPYLRAELVHEFDDQADQISGFVTVLPEAQFTLNPTPTDGNYGYAGAGLTGTFANNWSAFADYDMLLGFDALDNWQLTLGLRKQF